MVLIMKKSFEDYLTFLENQLDVKFVDWQKMFLRGIYDNTPVCFYGLISGRTILYKAACALKEEMNRDAGNLPSRLYELDGYSADTVICDEHWRENIEWEKENKI